MSQRITIIYRVDSKYKYGTELRKYASNAWNFLCITLFQTFSLQFIFNLSLNVIVSTLNQHMYH